jgi:hypothetical protein
MAPAWKRICGASFCCLSASLSVLSSGTSARVR